MTILETIGSVVHIAFLVTLVWCLFRLGSFVERIAKDRRSLRITTGLNGGTVWEVSAPHKPLPDYDPNKS